MSFPITLCIVDILTAQATEDYVYFGIYAIDLNYKTNGLDFVDLMMFKLWTLLDQINKSLNYSPSCRVKKNGFENFRKTQFLLDFNILTN